jgi:MYXO-CTERM domain-containing protein
MVIEDPTDNLPDIISDDGGGLPAPGIGVAIMALIGAGLVRRRRD